MPKFSLLWSHQAICNVKIIEFLSFIDWINLAVSMVINYYLNTLKRNSCLLYKYLEINLDLL